MRDYYKQIGCNEKLLSFLDSISPINQLYWYKAYLYKDKNEYGHEREWRMLYYGSNNENNFVSIPDNGCLKAIYYGPDIDKNYKVRLHEIALEKKIKEYDVSLDTESREYDLKINLIE